MRKFYLLSTLVLALLLGSKSYSQDFSNKGKEFWLAYCYHVGMNGGGSPSMTVYLTSDVTTTYNVEIYGVTTVASGTIFANQVIPVFISTAYFANTNGIIQNRTIHVTAAKPIVVYSFITRSQASAATLCLPTNVLGKEYVASSFTQVSNENLSNSYITIIGVEDNTSVEITPTATTVAGWAPGVTQTITINKGEIYQVLGTTSGTSGVDLSGTTINSVASAAGGCRKIAVYSGSGKITIGCNGSSDNLYQQLYPVSTWGKKYLTAPSFGKPFNYFRIYRSNPGSNVYLNGVLINPASFINDYYTFVNSSPNLIEADRPVAVSQYFTSQNCAGNGNLYDPDMIVLSPVEQNIKNVTLVSSPLTVAGAHQHNLQIIIKNTGTSLSSFLFDGAAVPVGSWIPHPQDGNYSYLYLANVAAGNHSLVSDTGFNALAYGYGNAETYGYSAGANVRDLYQQVGVFSQYGIELTPSVCVSTPFKFKVSLPYCVDDITWDLSSLPGPPPAPPTEVYTTCAPGPGGPDSTTVVNGVTLYWYSLPTNYSISPSGSYPITITTHSSVLTTCGSENEIDFDLDVYDGPVVDFTFTTPKCIAEPVSFNDNSVTPRPSYMWNWNFGDPGSGAANTSTLVNPTHTFSTPGPHIVTFYPITMPGCVGTPFTKTVNVPAMPTGTVAAPANVCVNSVTNITFTGADGTAPYTFYYHMPPSILALSVNSAAATALVPVNTTVPGTFTYVLDSIRNVGSTVCVQNITGQSVTVTVDPDHAISVAGSPDRTVCINTLMSPITYTLSGGATGATVLGLPAGVTFSVTGTTLTISGTPTGAGGGYTITTTGNACAFANAGGTITVNPAHAISAIGSPDRTVCINTLMTQIQYTLSGGATGVNVAGLPAGVTYSVTGTTLTISGTPTGAGGAYTITTTGNTCTPVNTGGTITVNPAHGATVTGSPDRSICINLLMTPIIYTLSGGATNANVTGLPAGVTFSVTGNTLTISGTPTSAGGAYTVTTSGNACAPVITGGMITVSPDHAISAIGSPDRTVCINTLMTQIQYTLSGGATGATVAGLPAGVTYSVTGNTLTISGTPTGAGGGYTITTTGNLCTPVTAGGTITVNPAHGATVTGSPDRAICINTLMSPITYTLSGGATNANVTGLPAGVTFSITGTTLTISGTPTGVGGAYTVTTSGNACAPVITGGTITVNPDHAISAIGSPDRTVCINTLMTQIQYTLSGGATGATIAGLPAGVTYSVTGNILTISGTPTGAGGAYTITTTGNACTPVNTGGTITVNPAHGATVTGSADRTVCINTLMAQIQYTLSGGATNANVTGLPAGVTFSVTGTTLTISGTPTGVGGAYTVTTSGNACAPVITGGTITVNPDHAISAIGSPDRTVCINTLMTQIQYTLSGGATGATVLNLPAGVTYSVTGNTLTISGTPTGAGGAYTITTTGNACTPVNTGGTITVNPAHAIAVTGSSDRTLCINTLMSPITYTLSGGATNAAVTGLPAGVTFSVTGTTLTISGTPTGVGGAYTITTSGNACAPVNAGGTITVNPDHALALSSATGTDNQSICINTLMTQIQYTLSGGATGATVSNLPAGVTYSVTGTTLTISGTPTGTGGAYTIATSGNGCTVANGGGTITVTPAHALTLTSGTGSDDQAVCINTAMNPISYTLSGGANNANITGLPAGVTFSVTGNTLTIQGTPAGAGGTFNITTSGNSCTPAVVAGKITVNPDHTITLTSATSTTDQTVCTDRSMTAITYNLGGGATGATVSNLPPGVTASVTGNILTIQGIPTTVNTYNYTIQTTGNSCVKANAGGRINVLLTPAVQFDPVVGICQDVPAFQVNALPASGVFSGPGINGAGLFTPSIAGAGDHIIRYTYTAANGCDNYQEQKIAVYPLPIVDAGPDRGMIEGGQITFNPVITANFPVTYAWTPAQYITNPAIANAVVTSIPDDRTFTLLVTSDHGCSATDKVFVKLLRKVEIPNIFSPNGDSIHDTWVIQYLESYPGCTVDIFNRYGQRIYHTEGYTKPWDGTINGKPVPVGTYYYIVNPKNGRSQMSGYVDIIR